jgi:hypothetical protein
MRRARESVWMVTVLHTVKIFFFIAVLARKQHIETGASKTSETDERNISNIQTHARLLSIPALRIVNKKHAIQLLHSLLLIFNLGKVMIPPGVTAFRLVDSLFAYVFHKYIVYSVVVEFLPLFPLSAGIYIYIHTCIYPK